MRAAPCKLSGRPVSVLPKRLALREIRSDLPMSDDFEIQRGSSFRTEFVAPRCGCGAAMVRCWMAPPGRHGSHRVKYVCETCNRTVVSALVPARPQIE
jgi:hypothetical protein